MFQFIKTFIISNIKHEDRKLRDILNPLAPFIPAYKLLLARLDGEINDITYINQLQKHCAPITLNCYDLVVLYNFIHDSLVSNGLLGKTSRASFVYFSREAGEIFYGQRETAQSLTVYVINEQHLTIVQNAVQDRISKMQHRNKSPFQIPTIEVVLLKNYPFKYQKWKADIFGNIPFIVQDKPLDQIGKN